VQQTLVPAVVALQDILETAVVEQIHSVSQLTQMVRVVAGAEV
jgi:hypothetical protein